MQKGHKRATNWDGYTLVQEYNRPRFVLLGLFKKSCGGSLSLNIV